ncbi:preprotein translocase subunit YajC [Pseudalkalibacillus salsuginis]|uniref:preprotein translocase subunit YajC n=1 Tax=Pseudalkalibacillus salsuginis TaxID=2910972 RepID=UPI001CD79C75|nr:preprotein translocase subunit YajC [Pseudalkalibacillus salsuginis]MCF6408639.1 preprotein translocase subunit YajC [Pseudalkalibacillus salsuginis]
MEGLGGLIPIILMFVIFYFILIRPQQKRQKKTAQMQASLEKGNRVITIGGLHATVEAIDEENNSVVLRAGDGSKLTYDRSAIREVVDNNQ